MDEEKKTLLKAELTLTYYKENIDNRYVTRTEDIVLDNAVLDDLAKKIYITPFDKYIKLQNNWNELKKMIEEKRSLNKFSEENRTETAYYKLLRELSNKMQEVEEVK